VTPTALAAALRLHPEVKAVFLTHNETSTGVTNPLPDLARMVNDHGALTIVDAVSSAGGLPLETDAWGLDFVLSGSQKAWMCPPGLMIAAVREKAWVAYERSRFPRFFWDIGAAKRSAEQGMTPTTPSLTLLYAYHAALRLILDEGLEGVWDRHHRLGRLTRRRVRAIGLELFADPTYASDTVTAFRPPAGKRAGELLDVLRREHGVEAQAGQAHLADQLVRIGHMGWAHEPELRQALDALERAIATFGPRRQSVASVASE
jgi:aspartate aminotransferase-like enzyme